MKINMQKREIVTCATCSNQFQALISDGRKYCSQKCANQYQRKSNPTKKATFVCGWCSAEFVDWAYRQCRFCSNQCRSEFAARQPKAKARRPDSYIQISCKQCDKTYAIHKMFTEKRKSSFCSNKCKYSWLSENMVGESNPNWVNGEVIAGRGPNWGRQSRKARKRDDYTCQECGDAWISDDKLFDVHHIIPYRLFKGDYHKANRLSNLVYLCRMCHSHAESAFRKLERISIAG